MTASTLPPSTKKLKPAGCIEEAATAQRLLAEGTTWRKIWDEDVEGEDADREIAFSPRGRYVAVSLQGGGVVVWDLCPLPHVMLHLDVPAQLSPPPTTAAAARADATSKVRGRGSGGNAPHTGEEVEYVVAGMSWSGDASILLVTYHRRSAAPGSYLCRWNLRTATVEAHVHLPGPGVVSAAQLSPADDSLCAYFVGGSACLCLRHVGGPQDGQVREANVSSDATAATADADLRLGLCLFGEQGTVLYCVCIRDRRVLKLETATLKELARSADILPVGIKTMVHKLRLTPDGRNLFMFTNRVAHLLETAQLRDADPLGDFGAIKIEWGCWGLGPDRDGPNAQLVVIGVPSPFTRDNVQERLFVWRLGGPRKREEDGEEDDGLPFVEPSPDMLPGFAQGLQGLEMCPLRAAMLGIGCNGGLFLRQETFTTGFPGPMYAPGYTVLESNCLYLEKEDELDHVVLPEGKTGVGEDAAAAVAALPLPGVVDTCVTTDEAVDVDVVGEGKGDVMRRIVVKSILVNRGLEEQVAFPVVLRGAERRKRHAAQEGEGDSEDESDEEVPGGFGDYLPMPAALVARKRKALRGGGGEALAAQRQKAVDEWAAKGRDRIREALAKELADSEAAAAAAVAKAAEAKAKAAEEKKAAAAAAAAAAQAQKQQAVQHQPQATQQQAVKQQAPPPQPQTAAPYGRPSAPVPQEQPPPAAPAPAPQVNANGGEGAGQGT